MAASKERRGKTAAAAPATKKSSSSLSTQLDRATETLHQNAAQIARLHGQWRSYLTLLSYLVVLLSFHQFQSISSACLYDIKAWNQHHESAAAAHEQPNANDPRIVSGAQAVTLVLRDAAAVVLGIVMASLLCAWLQKAAGEQTADLTHPLYRTAQSCVLPVLGIFYYQTFHKQTNTCLEDLLLRDDDDEQPTLPQGLELPSATNKKNAAGFPVVLVFHAIVTACVWFMNKQRTTLLQSEAAVQELRDELQQAAETKKKK